MGLFREGVILCEAKMALFTDNKVVYHPDLHCAGGIHEGARKLFIFRRWLGNPAGVVVD